MLKNSSLTYQLLDKLQFVQQFRSRRRRRHLLPSPPLFSRCHRRGWRNHGRNPRRRHGTCGQRGRVLEATIEFILAMVHLLFLVRVKSPCMLLPCLLLTLPQPLRPLRLFPLPCLQTLFSLVRLLLDLQRAQRKPISIFFKYDPFSPSSGAERWRAP